MKKKAEIIFTLPACMGGVASFNLNLINHSKLIKEFYSKVILIKEENDRRPIVTENFNADEVIWFEYSEKENNFFVQKRLSKLLGTSKGVIVTDNSLTIYSAKRFQNPKTIFHLIHDYYYVNQNVKMGDLVDVAIAHSSFFKDVVYASNPDLFKDRIIYIPYGVRQLDFFPDKNDDSFNLVFLGRLVPEKGVLLLKKINDLLISRGVFPKWNIIGKGHLKHELIQQWIKSENVEFFEFGSTHEIYNLLRSQDVFVFPTSFEGTPVSILECMANGVLTLTNDLPGGIRDIVNEPYGYRYELNMIEKYVEKLCYLHSNKEKMREMQHETFHFARKNYDVDKNSDKYFEVFLNYEKFKRPENHTPISGSFLDRPLFPNFLVKFFRNL